MGVKVTDLADLPQDVVDQVVAELTQLMQEAHPEVELTRGVVHDLLLQFGAVLGAAVSQTNIDRLRLSSSLLAISQTPDIADEDTVDLVMSNYGVTRRPGATATGQARIVVSANSTVVIPNGQIFTGNGMTFKADSAFTGRPSGSSLPNDTDRELQPLGDGTYAFVIELTAVETGTAGNIKRGTKLVPSSLPATFVTAFAENDFSDGVEDETNEALLERLQSGIAAKAWSNRLNIEAMIKDNTDFSQTIDVSIIGFGDEEMSRDQHWIWPMSGGGRSDVYVRTRELPVSSTLTKTATLVEKRVDGGVWQFSIQRDEAPGFYEVERIVLPSAGSDDTGYEVLTTTRGLDTSDVDYVPDLEDAEEAAFSRYQTAVIQFLDTDTAVADLAIGATATYSVAVSAMPQIDELQDYLGGRSVRDPAGDVLVRACIPCLTAVSFEILRPATADDPDTDSIRNAIASMVNNLGFSGKLHASKIASVIHEYLEAPAAVGEIELFGKIIGPDGAITYIRSSSVLEIPDLPERAITGRTTSFILDPNSIGVSVVAGGFAEA